MTIHKKEIMCYFHIHGYQRQPLKQLDEHVISLKKNPPIPTGQKDPYEPK